MHAHARHVLNVLENYFKDSNQSIYQNRTGVLGVFEWNGVKYQTKSRRSLPNAIGYQTLHTTNGKQSGSSKEAVASVKVF